MTTAPCSKRPDSATRRAQLLDAADAVFTAHGVNVPLEQIIAHARVGRATLYRQFPDRQALLLALMERSAEHLSAYARQLPPQPDNFFALLAHMAERTVRSPALVDYWRTTSLSDARFTAVRQRVWDVFAPALARAQSAGLVRADIGPSDIALLSGMLAAAQRGPTEAARRRLSQQALDILRRGLLPSSAVQTPSEGAA